MNQANPRVSIGVPVFNGESFLAKTLDALLTQTFTDFEIVISDNASTDHTEAICRSYAARDTRIRYYRSDENHGAAWNHNRAFELSRGEFFKWNSADDMCAPEFLARCVTALDNDPAAVMACGQVSEVDENETHIRFLELAPELASPKPSDRFSCNIDLGHLCQHIYSLVRSSALRKTDLIGNYTDSDRMLLAHLALFGHVALIHGILLFNRTHSGRSTLANPDWRERMYWFDPLLRNKKVFPFWRELKEMWGVIGRSSISLPEKLRCYSAVCGWFLRHRHWFRWELQYYPKQWVIAHVPGAASCLRWLKTTLSRMRTRESVGHAQQ